MPNCLRSRCRMNAAKGSLRKKKKSGKSVP
jgi:hypothetical protein